MEVIISRKDCETHQECVKRLFPLGLRTGRMSSTVQSSKWQYFNEIIALQDVTDTWSVFFLSFLFRLRAGYVRTHFVET